MRRVLPIPASPPSSTTCRRSARVRLRPPRAQRRQLRLATDERRVGLERRRERDRRTRDVVVGRGRRAPRRRMRGGRAPACARSVMRSSETCSSRAIPASAKRPTSCMRDAVGELVGDQLGRGMRHVDLAALVRARGCGPRGSPRRRSSRPCPAALRRCACRHAPTGGCPPGTPRSASARWNAIAAAAASVARANAESVLSPSPCERGIRPPCASAISAASS